MCLTSLIPGDYSKKSQVLGTLIERLRAIRLIHVPTGRPQGGIKERVRA
jgi:hypothetical protein